MISMLENLNWFHLTEAINVKMDESVLEANNLFR